MLYHVCGIAVSALLIWGLLAFFSREGTKRHFWRYWYYYLALPAFACFVIHPLLGILFSLVWIGILCIRKWGTAWLPRLRA